MSQDPNQPYPPSQPGPYDQPGGYQQPPSNYPPQGDYQQQGGYQQQGYGSQQNPQNPYEGQPGYQQNPYGAPAGGTTSAYGPSSMNMDPKTAAGLSYVALWVTGLIFFLVEKQNRFVRFHAMQSIIFFGGLSVLGVAFNFAEQVLPFPLDLLLLCINGLVGIVGLVGWIVLMINGFQGKYFKLPVIGDYAERYANQGTL